jgi:glucose-1-phosphate cytidylyltransferase
MKTVILAGGLGTRLGEYTASTPKPMVTIGGIPLIWHIMKLYSSFGYNDFYLALGYKSEVFKEYFLNFRNLNSDFKVDLSNGEVSFYKNENVNWKITLVDTGTDTMTGGRLKRLKDYIDEDPFFLTYGDGLANVDIDKLLTFHKKHGKLVTLTAVRPPARFGVLTFDDDNKVNSFQEKSQLSEGWINGGFFVVNPDFLKYLEDDSTILERDPLEKISQIGQLMAYKHHDFWQCMDTKRDRDFLEDLWLKDRPWLLNG